MSRHWNVREFGARGNGRDNDAKAINAAIAQCVESGGGEVFFPKGDYAAASICLCSNVHLVLDDDATIIGAKSGYEPPEPNPFDAYQDFGHSHFRNALIRGENVENCSIVGGRINGGHLSKSSHPEKTGDKVIAIRSGRGLRFENITHESGAHFVYLLNDCEEVEFRNIIIKESRDGVNLVGCRRVRIQGCRFTGCGDDTLALKTDWALGRPIPIEDVLVSDCYFESSANALQFGAESASDFRNVRFENITIGRAGKAGLGLNSNDGGTIDGVTCRNISMRHVVCPVFLMIQDRLRSGDPAKKVGRIRNIDITGLTVTNCAPGPEGFVHTATISGRPEAAIENVRIEHSTFEYPGDGRPDHIGREMPYPQRHPHKTLGPRPAAGLWIRHARDVVLRNVKFTFDKPDPRPVISGDNVQRLTLDKVHAPHASSAGLHLVSSASIEIIDSPGFDL